MAAVAVAISVAGVVANHYRALRFPEELFIFKFTFMIREFTTSPARQEDTPAVLALLQRAKLPIEDLGPELKHFFVARDNNTIVAAIGLELYGQYGLLRSMVTDPAYRNKGAATHLVNDLMAYAGSLSLKEIYLLTQTAEIYFSHRGFEKINRDDVPADVKQSAEFSHLCPSSAVAMRLQVTPV